MNSGVAYFAVGLVVGTVGLALILRARLPAVASREADAAVTRELARLRNGNDPLLAGVASAAAPFEGEIRRVARESAYNVAVESLGFGVV